jgi:hypothetical protein
VGWELFPKLLVSFQHHKRLKTLYYKKKN